MALKDRMKDVWQDSDEVERKVASSAFSSITDSIVDTDSAVKVLAVTVTAEIAAFTMLYVSKDKVQDYLAESGNNVSIYGSFAAFLIGFLTAFAAFRLIFGNFPRNAPGYMIWPISLAAGVGNVALFFLLINFQMR